MPTYKHAYFIRRAVESLRAQTFTDWELIIVDDGSPDHTRDAVASYLNARNIHYVRHERNRGIGDALNTATEMAKGRYIAYLPSDDVYYPDHLERLVQLLDANPDIYLSYGGVRWNYETYAATLRGDEFVGREAEALLDPPPEKGALLTNGNLFAMVQVMHRRDFEPQVRWQTRRESVTDRLEPNYWRSLLECGVRVGYAGAVTCEWVDHPEQHHKLIASSEGGISRYRQYYDIPRGEALNWQPSFGPRVDERERFRFFRMQRNLPKPGGMKILLVGELGFNPERILAFEERGHKLYGMWMTEPESWDATGPFSWGNVEMIRYRRGWESVVRAVQPDVIYALLNWQAIPMIYDVFDANLGIPFVFHFKEGPFICQEKGTWSKLMRLLHESDGQVYINQESFDWFQLASDGALSRETAFILDGDLPKLDHFTEDWSPKLSDQDGEIHTVCAGRLIGMGEVRAMAAAGIHVHFYGDHFHQMSPNTIREGMATGHWHLHPTVGHADWTRELSKYDAAWFHNFDSRNDGDLRRANWDDLNLPARLGGYAAAGLPWILKDNRRSIVALQSAAQRHDIGVFFNDYDDLATQLRDRTRLKQLTKNARAARAQFAFDTHADALIAFFQQAIERAGVAERIPRS